MNNKTAKKIRRTYKRRIDFQVGKDIKIHYGQLLRRVKFWRIMAPILLILGFCLGLYAASILVI